jgi:hypothetical protein
MEDGKDAELSRLIAQIYDEKTGGERMDVLDEIASLLSSQGLGLQYSHRPPPVSGQSESDIFSEYEQLTGRKLQKLTLSGMFLLLVTFQGFNEVMPQSHFMAKAKKTHLPPLDRLPQLHSSRLRPARLNSTSTLTS